MRFLFPALLGLHGLIHLLGFAKAFQLGDTTQLSKDISKPEGILWLGTTILFLVAFVLYFLQQDYWALVAVLAAVISQILIFGAWSDAKWGTLANLVILGVALPALGARNFENNFRQDVQQAFSTVVISSEDLIMAKDLDHLPQAVQRYLQYVGVVGQPKVQNMKLVMEGEMRSKEDAWFAFTSEQYNNFTDPSRLFFMKAKVKGLPTAGYHAYREGEASMNIKLLSLYPVVDLSTTDLFKTETVTYFNDLCLFAPAALIDPTIQWEEIDSLTTKATFSNKGVTITATLIFAEDGRLLNFISDDRMDINAGKYYRFSTPTGPYGDFNGYRLATYGEAIWHYPEGKFVYGKFKVQKVVYNIELQSL